MSSFFWNVRGFNKTSKHSIIRNWIREGRFDFGCLLETKVKERKSEKIISDVFQGWSIISNYEHNGRGRIWVLWRDSACLTPVFKSSQMVTCSVSLKGQKEFFCSFIYALNEVDDRKELWDDIRCHHNSPLFRGKPWLLCGDFNEVLDCDEHSDFNGITGLAGMRDFQATVQYCSLVDLGYQGPNYTWTNKRTAGLICKKLDRALVNEHWLDLFPNSYNVFEAGGCSDHLRGRIRLDTEQKSGRKPFKFVNVLTRLPQFIPTVEEYWETTAPIFSSTSALYRFSKKLKSLKPAMRSLYKDKLGDLSKRTKEAYEILCSKQISTLENPSEAAMEEERNAENTWTHLASLEEGFLKQRAKVHWLGVGDRNNKFFHKSIQARKAQNLIREIRNHDGEIVTSTEEIKDAAEHYFRGFLTTVPEEFQGMEIDELQKIMDFRCTEGDCATLCGEITEEEIKKTLFAMPNDKSPGPDGYTSEFFKSTWSIIKNDFLSAVKSFFTKGFLPKGLNTTILALIPKKESALEMKDYRPISLCNVLYKVISKILANRLKVVLPQMIAQNQSAFVKERLLMENVLLASELVKDYQKENISSRCAMKIDISKAFDSVQWSFLLNTLAAQGFPDQFIHWIRLCITTASFSVQVNGELAGFFQSKRGLRQGCALSPYLFFICMNVLSRMIDRAAMERKIGYHPKCKLLKLTHLCFADDLMVFVDGKRSSIDGILTIFGDFAGKSGLRISIEKSTVYLAGLNTREKNEIISDFPFAIGEFPVRYLGLPLMTKRMTTTYYTVLIEKLRKQMSSWTARLLSYAGKLQLLQSVIASVVNFWIAAFRLPQGCIQKIEQLCASFLWSGPELNPRKAKIAWLEVRKTKREGGLGFRPIKEANNTCCLKLIWRILSAKTLWVKWIHQSYLKKETFWSVKANANMGSWMWRKLLKYREVAKGFHRVQPRNGESTSFWFDHWSSLGRLHDITGQRGQIDMGLSLIVTLASAMRSHRPRLHRSDFLNQIELNLRNMKDANRVEDDVHLWKSNENQFVNNFKSRNTWNLLREHKPEVNWYKGVWFTYATPKYQFQVWLAMHNRMTTGDRMQNWGDGQHVHCFFCDFTVETRDHLFFQCPYSSQVWNKVASRLLAHDHTNDWTSLVQLLQFPPLDKINKFLFRYVFQTALYHLWRERNNRRHGQRKTCISELARGIDKNVRNRLTSIRKLGGNNYEGAMQRWFSFAS